MTEQALTLNGARLTGRASGALWWAEERLLCVADLHLGKSERIARRGGALLPPYETAETLDRLEAEIAALDPEMVVCLGDSFDDGAAEAGLEATARVVLARMAAGRTWVWVAGNHDPGALAEVRLGALVFRHAAAAAAGAGEISGHYHPKLRMVTAGRAISRRCFVCDGRRLVLPAFGAFTGGLDADTPVIAGLFGPEAVAVLVGEPCVRVPLWTAAGRRVRAGRLRG